ncbi:L-threonylcarbamoyladenylate synthase [Bifidobacterium sp.]|jgi:tRNA threonylcarbamoyl adenosine modification protein (Sua5/YciO/YrdC/YwlC family)|uniref:L-threonylcarbamoyladenylate synthase n=1 Tax=Bifidobacterium sp. TaxID=41200 RepID=UPI0025C17934|nr:L-threonylcarbamoyladenylate synthase [Bifidobacterium sp.]MCH4209648.1 threonylcarbamoyl-AMP synthase [Bifidobacterium sp.]MCI1224825.1 threonylcarbamoyl-AMP synthase [Bifidobacterium sp.]
MSEIRAVTDESLAFASDIVRRGGLVVIPTDTVYGVACDPFNAKAIDRIYGAKRRPRYKALQIILSSIDELEGLGLYLPAPLNRLAATFLPGAFSPIAQAAQDGDFARTLGTLRTESNGKRTQAIRIPNSTVSLQILKAIGPVAASSANRSGGESPQTAQEAYEALGDDVELYLDGGATQGHIASTVVAADPHERDGIAIIREGMIPASVIRRALTINGGGLGA